MTTAFRGPGHWPDADMIPFGNVRTWKADDHWTHFTNDEHYTLMTLWSIGRSPLILGGNLPNNTDFELSLLTNDEVIAVNQNSTNGRQLSNANGQIAWVADTPDSKDKYVAMFNAMPLPAGGRGRGRGRVGAAATPASAPSTSPAAVAAATQPAVESLKLSDIGFGGPCAVRDLWTHKDLGAMDTIVAAINSHGAVLYRVSPK
jgi:hypothetical protein